jgi:MFS transporter, PAT family, beta-lactamase induction signal transducer AmpG
LKASALPSGDVARARFRGLRENVGIYADRRVIAILFLGFASGLPLMLVAGTLSTWLREAEVSRAAIGLFAFVFAPYTFKFAWAPVMDRLPLPPLTTWLGRRRGWMLAAQIGLMASIWGLGRTDPASELYLVAAMALAVAFFSASQDVVIDAYRVESLPERKLGAGAGVIVLGYRVGMFVATWGALRLADAADWGLAYTVMAALVGVGMVTALLVPEPPGSHFARPSGGRGFKAWLASAVVEPFGDFFGRHGVHVAVVILVLISVFKASDVLLTMLANPFYIDMGFTKAQIADVTKLFGVWMTVAGGLVGGVVVFRLGILKAMVVAALLMAGSNLMFAVLTWSGPQLPVFIATIAVENLSGGIGTAVFVAFLSALCNVHYTAVQYALLTSFMQLFGKFVIVPSSGFYADAVGWMWFFVTSTVFALPAIALVLWLVRHGPEIKVARPETPADGA